MESPPASVAQPLRFGPISFTSLRSMVSDRLMWGRMDMSPTDIADVTGATYICLMNGNPPGANWRALFNPVERVRLRFINTSSMTIFDVRIPGLLMICRAGRREIVYSPWPFVGAATTPGIRPRRLDEVSREAPTTDRAYFAQLTWYRSRKNVFE